jgi:phosphatidylserine decarboxylase
MHRFARIRLRVVREAQIGWFLRRYGVDLAEAQESDWRAYPHFNAFFTRALRPGARPFDQAPAGAVLSPADGRVSALGALSAGTLLQAKGHTYAARELLGTEEDARPFQGGRYLTVYLSPRDYHRVHMPAAGRLVRLRYVPGRLFSVNAATTRRVPRLFARNERVVALFETELGRMAVVLVGAFFVGGLETVWTGPITPPHGGRPAHWDYPDGHPGTRLPAAAEMGRFNLGSTVVVLLEGSGVRWDATLSPGRPVRAGQVLGTIGTGG